MSDSTQTFDLRPVTRDDAELLYKWANDPIARLNSFNTGKVEFDQHCSWLDSKLNSRIDWLYIFLVQSQYAGLIRFHEARGEFEVGFQLDPDWRGRGLGKVILDLGIGRIRSEIGHPLRVIGQVKPTNTPSLKSFQSLGFSQTYKVKDEELTLIFVKDIP